MHSELHNALDEQFRIAKRGAIAKYPLAYKLPEGILDFGAPWQLTGDWMIVGDVHVPSTDWELAALVASVAKKAMKRPRRLLIAGDLFNMDKFSFYPHLTLVPSWKDERDSAKLLFTEWGKVFDEIRWFVGNHERRLQRILVDVLEDSDLLGVIKANPDQVRFSNYSYCTIDAGSRWLIIHPRNYSRNQLTVAKQLAHKTRLNIISFHEHHIGIGWDDSGLSMIINGGSLVDAAKVAYMTLDMSTTPVSKQGFVLLQNGTPTLFGRPPLTDWQKWVKT